MCYKQILNFQFDNTKELSINNKKGNWIQSIIPTFTVLFRYEFN